MHDKISDHYTSSENMTDELGNTRMFNFVDHDVKTKIGTNRPMTEEEKRDLKSELAKAKDRMISQILALPAHMCHEHDKAFILRGEREKILWNETMLRDPGINYDRLLGIYTLTSNKIKYKQAGLL